MYWGQYESFNGWSFSGYMDKETAQEMKNDQREAVNAIENKTASYLLDGCNYRARVVETTDSKTILISYSTPVLALHDDKIARLWDDWSATTQKHVNKFLTARGLPSIYKKTWLKLEPTRFYTAEELAEI